MADWLNYVRQTGESLKRRLLPALLLLGCLLTVDAISREADQEFLQRTWQAEDGLPNPVVRKLLLTRDGYLWVGTDESLLRFDGVRFTEFDRKDFRLKNDRWLVGLVEDNDGDIWASGSNGGLVRLRNGQSSQFTTNNGLPDNYVLSTYADKDGTIWVGTRSGLTRWKDGKFEDISREPGVINEAIRCFYEDSDGTLWIGTAKGVMAYKAGKFDSSLTEILPEKSIMAILETRDGSFWFGTPNGLVQMQNGKFKQFTIDHGLSHNTIRALLEDSAGNFWVGSHGGLQRMVQGEFFSVRFRDSSSLETGESVDDFVYDILEDREGNVWVGSSVGLKRFRPQKFEIYSREDGLPHDQVTCVYEDRAGVVWIGTFGGGLSRLENGVLTTFNNDTGLPSNHILSIHEDKEGTLWIGTDGIGLIRYQHGTFKTFRGRNAQANVVRIIHETRDGTLWVVNNSGAEKFKDEKFVVVNELATVGIRCMLEAKDGSLWFGGKSGVIHYSDGKINTYRESSGLSSEWVNALHEDEDGVIWIGTELGGLNRLKDGKFKSFSEKQQFRERILHIVEDLNGRLWLGTKNGIFSIRKSELSDFLDGKSSSANVISYGRVDGMKRAQCNGIGQPAGLQTGDGRIWFPTLYGVVSFDPKQVGGNTAVPFVALEKVLVNGAAFPIQTGRSKLPPSSGDIEFHYTGLSFIVPERVRFKYQLEGVDTDWQEAGTRRVANYSIQRPGDYTFRVKACNNDGVWSESDASFSFTLEPHFYQSYSFYVLCALGFVAIGAGAYGLRLRNLKKREQELMQVVSERTKELQQEVNERKQAERRSSVFSKLGQRLSLVNSAEEAAKVIVEAADELIGWDACNLYSYSEQEDKGRPLVFFDVVDGKRTNVLTRRQMELSPVARRTLKRGAQLILRKEPLVSSQDYQPFGDKSRPSASLMFVPIHKGEKVVGILSIQSYKINAYTPADLDTLQALADYCGTTFEQIRAEAALRQSQQMVLRQERLAAVGQLSAGVAHEFNNILTIIKGHAALLLEDRSLNPDAVQSADQINGSAERAANLTRQMLAFSRKQILQPRTIELNEITADVAKMLGRLIGENISIHCTLQPGLPSVCADPAMVEQVLINLALNARDAMPKGGQLTISTSTVEISDTHTRTRSEAYPGSFVCLTVSDTGCGMDEIIQQKIFEPFFTTKEVGKGTGLGLATVYGIVQQHRGWIEVTSKVGVGTAFNVFLPIDGKGQTQAPKTARDPAAKGGKETILFVEDEPDIRQLARQLLQQIGYKVLEAASGVEALKVWAEHKHEINLLLTDMMMPEGVSGGELAKKLQTERPELKVIYMSGYSVEILEQDLRDKKNFRFLEKPYRPQALIQIIRECLDAKE